jgi:hypothetical protein
MDFTGKLFNIHNERAFNEEAVGIFRRQYYQNPVYHRYVDSIGRNSGDITEYRQIPFLPVAFFKTHRVFCGEQQAEKVFLSSGTTGMQRSRHEVADLGIYRESLLRGFENLYGPLPDYDIFALMPSPEENPDSSLIFMVSEWMDKAGSEISGFYLRNFEKLAHILSGYNSNGRKPLLIGLSYALLEFAPGINISHPDLIIMETGGMKGRRKEMIREEVHEFLKENFGVETIHSEYGMTELLSQAYSSGNGQFLAPPWMKILIRDPGDPFQLFPDEKTGCINIIDLANISSCSFIATEDLGRTHPDGSFEVLGRFDSSEVRGCNLMIG